MKKLLLLILLICCFAISKAQTLQAVADSNFAHKEYVKAYDNYSLILKTDPNNVQALRRAGYCLMNCKGQELNATRYFNSALKLQPNDAVSSYYLGVIYMDAAKQETDKAQKANFKALAQSRLKDAAMNGSKEAKDAINDLNAI